MKLRLVALGLLIALLGTENASANDIRLTVFAASSLAQPFSKLGKSFEATHPGIKIQFSFQSSSTLASQLLAGAPADLLASASIEEMAKARIRVPDSTVFVSNRIVLGVLPDSKIRINKITDLNRRGVTWIQCAHNAPCGVVTDKALSVFGKVTSHPVSLEANSSSVVAKLIAGEVDAAFIYHTDFIAHSTLLKEIRFADTPSTRAEYSMGIVSDSKNRSQGQSFMQYILSAQGLAVLSRAGFTRISR